MRRLFLALALMGLGLVVLACSRGGAQRSTDATAQDAPAVSGAPMQNVAEQTRRHGAFADSRGLSQSVADRNESGP